jgi:hypothetical protein
MRSVVSILFLITFSTLAALPQTFRPQIPKVWDEQAIADMEIPLPSPAPKPVHVSEEYYYSIPEITIYRTYPRQRGSLAEEAAYIERLKNEEPVVAFDQAQLRTEEDWIRAGELVFRTSSNPIPYQPATGPSYVIRQKGIVEINSGPCTVCHSQRQSDGSILFGIPSTNANNYAFAVESTSLNRMMRALFSTPWRNPDPNVPLTATVTSAEIVSWRLPGGGITDRIGTSLTYPLQIPSLIGIKDRKYFDHSGRHRHRSIGDLMRSPSSPEPSSSIDTT